MQDETIRIGKHGDVTERADDRPARLPSLEARAPYQAPRRREHDAAALARFRRWLSGELGLGPAARIEVTEWVSFDVREAPHTTVVSVVSGGRQRAVCIGKALEDIERADVVPRAPRRARVRSTEEKTT